MENLQAKGCVDIKISFLRGILILFTGKLSLNVKVIFNTEKQDAEWEIKY